MSELPARPGRLNGLRHIALLVPNLEECERFYVDVLGMEVLNRANEDLVYLTCGNDNLSLGRGAGAANGLQTLDHYGFIVDSVEELEAWYQYLKAKGVTVSLGSRNSYPVYDDKGQKITAWRERAELRLESSDFAALSQLTASLLGKLKMGNMSFSIADSTRQQNEDSLMKNAVAAFKARAQLLTDSLGGKGYRLVNLNLNSAGAPRPMPVMRMAAMKADAGFAAAPEIEAGTSQVTVTADGTIEVQMP